MESMGPAPAARLELRRSEDGQPQERQQPMRKGNNTARRNGASGPVEEDLAQVAAAEPENHQLDERA